MSQGKIIKKSWKVVFLGAASVGKTSIINRFMYGDFLPDNAATTGIDFFTKTINQGNLQILLQMWDTAGQEKFQSLIPSYIRDTKIAILVYSVNDPKSFDEVKAWKKRVEQQNGDETKFLFVGNKIDLEEIVSSQEGQTYADSCNSPIVFCSAKTNEGIDDIFTKLAQDVVLPQTEITPKNVIVPTQTEITPKEEEKEFNDAPAPEKAIETDKQPSNIVQLKPNDSQEQQTKSSGCC